MNKGVLILGGIIVLAVIAMFAFGFGNDKTQDGGGAGIAAVQQSEANSQTAKTQTEPKVKTETKKSLLPKAMRRLTPEETVQAFVKATQDKKYDEALKKYVSSESQIQTVYDIEELSKYIFFGYTTLEIRGVEYSDTSKVRVKVRYKVWQGDEYMSASTMNLQKEEGIWKILSI